MKLNLSFWKNATPKMKRFYSFVFVFVVVFVVLLVGSSIQLSPQDAYMVSNQLNQTLQQGQATGTLTPFIFVNNFEICLLMFVPIIGPALGLFIIFDTGLAIGAIATTQGYPVYLGLISLVVTPVFWLEFIAYSIAMAESVWLFRRLIQLKGPSWRGTLLRELKWTALAIGACAGILALGAVVEVWIINLFS